MKTLLFIVGMLGWAVVHAPAQEAVEVEVTLDQEQFLPGESRPAAVRITNHSGQQLHLGTETNWLTFNVESVDNFVVMKTGEVPVVGAFDLESSQRATKRVDLAPYFPLIRAGHYRILATLRIKSGDWNLEETSPPKYFDIINGILLWSQDFGVPSAAGSAAHAPEMRKYSLIKANYLSEQLRLYVQVSNPTDGGVYQIKPVGPLVTFSQPEAQVDMYGCLHVLYQNGRAVFSYTVVAPDGTFLRQDLYDYVDTRPRLGIDDHGGVVVTGGVRRQHHEATPTGVPKVLMPGELPQPVPVPAPVPAPAPPAPN
jgi:hypothetical protein